MCTYFCIPYIAVKTVLMEVFRVHVLVHGCRRKFCVWIDGEGVQAWHTCLATGVRQWCVRQAAGRLLYIMIMVVCDFFSFVVIIIFCVHLCIICDLIVG